MLIASTCTAHACCSLLPSLLPLSPETLALTLSWSLVSAALSALSLSSFSFLILPRRRTNLSFLSLNSLQLERMGRCSAVHDQAGRHSKQDHKCDTIV